MEVSPVSIPVRNTLRIVLGLICALLAAMPASLRAQVSTADIVGTATDPNGAAVVDGTATATNLATGITQTAPLGKSGDFTFTLLQIGNYSVTVHAPGFKDYQTQVTLAVGDRARVSAQLSVGEASQTVPGRRIACAFGGVGV